ncbi:integrase/recombinase xerD homolog [Eublepharis macularius]|uniref:Integrase/recombinase xerD homolog n=1 Tax=Eublepharis macularius TaxID=481883 RepID=A0AA97JMP8_EUBMA|nr:integrase/recombinase xerD homolog [Eublepharis macularius]
MQGVLSSVAPSTLQAYSAAASRFLAFSKGGEAGGSWPPSQAAVLRYLAHLRGLGRAPRTMRRDLAAISFFSKAAGFPDPCTCFLARRAVEGWARTAPPRRDRRRPITLAILGQVLQAVPSLCRSPYEAQLFRTAYILAFYGAFRVSELVAGSKGDLSGRAVAFKDVSWSPRRVSIRLRRSKTVQRGKGHVIHLWAARQHSLCPVRAADRFLSLRPSLSGPFLMHRDGSPLTRFQFSAILRAGLQVCGLAARDFGTHSFRIGAATVAANLGLPAAAIQAIGRWRSGAFRTYIRPAAGLSH